MRTQVKKWGNSLALRIPKSFAAESRLGQGSEVELTLQGGKLIVTPISAGPYVLDVLLDGITDANRHDEAASGAATGAEVW